MDEMINLLSQPTSAIGIWLFLLRTRSMLRSFQL